MLSHQSHKLAIIKSYRKERYKEKNDHYRDNNQEQRKKGELITRERGNSTSKKNWNHG